MRKLFPLLVIALLAVGVVQAQDAQLEAQPGDDGIGDPYFPLLGNGGYNVQHYDIDLTVDVEDNEIAGTTTIYATATQDLSQFNLDFMGFDIGDVTVDDQEAAFRRSEHELTVIPEQPIENETAFVVAVTYAGVPGAGVESGGQPIFAEGWTNYGRGVFVASEPSGAASWYPVNDHPRDKASYRFEITVDAPYVVAANGTLIDTVEADDQITYIWENEDDLASYLATVNIADFVRQDEEGPNGLPIRNYFPSDLAERGEEVFADQPEMVEFFSEIFGPYPFEAYGVVVADTELGFALETQTLSLFGRDILAPFSFGVGAQEVVAHELSHQWFGDSVSLANWQDMWLNEGFATYAQALWIEHTEGEEIFEDYMTGLYSLISQSAFSSRDVVVPGKPPANDLFNSIVYQRGAWTLHALRLEVGDDDFFDILLTYYDRFKYGNVTTGDFIGVAEEVSGQGLGDLFNAWLYEERVPDVPQMGLRAADND